MRLWKSKRLAAVQIGILAVTVVLAVLAPRYVNFVAVAENWASDFRVTFLNPPAERHSEIVILAITEETLQRLPYRSPVDRGFLAGILEELAQAKVRAVGFDILFDQPTEPEKDALFRRTVAAMPFPVVLGWTDPETGLTEKQYAFQKTFMEGLTAGYSNLWKDPVDGTVRNIFPGRERDGRYRLSFAGTLAESLGLKAPRERLRLAYRGQPDSETPAFPSFPAHALANLPKTWFAGKVVMVGADLPFGDRHRTPFAAGLGVAKGSFPGVVIQSHILAQLMEGRLGKGSNLLLEGLIALILGVVAVVLTFSEGRQVLRLGGGAVTLALLVGGNLLLFVDQGISAPLVSPVLAFGAAIGLGSAYGAAQGRHIRKAFGHYLSPVIVKRMADEGKMPEQGGELRDITVWISDMENYTTLSEIYSPTELVQLLNSVYTVMGDTVEDHGGFVAQFVGDAMVSAFGAPMDDPDHARHAVESAIACQARVAELEARTSLPQGLRLRNRIGISTGRLLAGNIGSKRRLSYTILGDDINLASRLEGVNKIYKSDILVNEVTVKACGPGLKFREVDIVRVKGRKAPVRIFQPLAANGAFPALGEDDLKRFAEALATFRDGRFSEAAAMFDATADRDPVAEAFAARAREMEADPPPPDWDGINTLLTK